MTVRVPSMVEPKRKSKVKRIKIPLKFAEAVSAFLTVKPEPKKKGAKKK